MTEIICKYKQANIKINSFRSSLEEFKKVVKNSFDRLKVQIVGTIILSYQDAAKGICTPVISEENYSDIVDAIKKQSIKIVNFTIDCIKQKTTDDSESEKEIPSSQEEDQQLEDSEQQIQNESSEQYIKESSDDADGEESEKQKSQNQQEKEEKERQQFDGEASEEFDSNKEQYYDSNQSRNGSATSGPKKARIDKGINFSQQEGFQKLDDSEISVEVQEQQEDEEDEDGDEKQEEQEQVEQIQKDELRYAIAANKNLKPQLKQLYSEDSNKDKDAIQSQSEESEQSQQQSQTKHVQVTPMSISEDEQQQHEQRPQQEVKSVVIKESADEAKETPILIFSTDKKENSQPIITSEEVKQNDTSNSQFCILNSQKKDISEIKKNSGESSNQSQNRNDESLLEKMLKNETMMTKMQKMMENMQRRIEYLQKQHEQVKSDQFMLTGCHGCGLLKSKGIRKKVGNHLLNIFFCLDCDRLYDITLKDQSQP